MRHSGLAGVSRRVTSNTASGTSQLTQVESEYNQGASKWATVARPPIILITTAEHKSMNVRHIHRWWLAQRRLTADFHPRTAHTAVANARELRLAAATQPFSA
jgi:hypothetical protein